MDFAPVTSAAFSVQPGKKYYLLRYPSHLPLTSLFPQNTTIASLPSTTPNRAFSKRRQLCPQVMTLTDSAPFSLYSAREGALVQLEGMMAVVESGGGKGVGREEREAAGAAVEASMLPAGRAIPQPDIIIRKRQSVQVPLETIQETPTKKKRSKKTKSVE